MLYNFNCFGIHNSDSVKKNEKTRGNLIFYKKFFLIFVLEINKEV